MFSRAPFAVILCVYGICVCENISMLNQAFLWLKIEDLWDVCC